MRNDKAEFELLLTVARLLRAHLWEGPGTGADFMLLNDALKPFDPLPGHGGDFDAGVVTYLPDGVLLPVSEG